MSSKIKGLRRVGIVGLSTVVAASMMTLSGVSAFAVAGTFTALTSPNVTQGATNQPAGNLTLEFANGWGTNAAQTFTIVNPGGAATCGTAATISGAIGFTAAPTVVVSDPAPANATAVAPAFTTTLGSSTTACASQGVKDVVTITTTNPATNPSADTFLVTLSNINYNVGTTAAIAGVTVSTAGGLFTGPVTAVNAMVVNFGFSNTALVAALPNAAGVSLGTQTFTESTPGAAFTNAGTGLTTVTLALSGANNFTAGITPVFTLPAGYTIVTPVPVTTFSSLYSFQVDAAATLVAAKVTVSGLTITALGAVETTTLSAVVGGAAQAAVPVVNVVNYAPRIGGATRYETAAALFNAGFAGFATPTDVVLSGGRDFPDALSANYLAGKLGTGTLLTAPAALSPAAFNAIVSHPISTVYITGLQGAVSNAVQARLEATHVSNNPNLALINVIRLGGADRYATNRIVNAFDFTAETTVLIAGGLNFPDSLSVGPIAYRNTIPLIITRGTTLSASEMTQIDDFNPTNVIIVGETGVVSAAIETALKVNYTVTRLGGADRTLTAAKVLTYATTSLGTPVLGTLFASNTTHITSGDNFPDALAAGPVAGDSNTMIMITRTPTVLGAGIPLYFGTKNVGATVGSSTTIGTLNALGLTGVTPNATMKAAAATIGFGN